MPMRCFGKYSLSLSAPKSSVMDCSGVGVIGLSFVACRAAVLQQREAFKMQTPWHSPPSSDSKHPSVASCWSSGIEMMGDGSIFCWTALILHSAYPHPHAPASWPSPNSQTTRHPPVTATAFLHWSLPLECHCPSLPPSVHIYFSFTSQINVTSSSPPWWGQSLLLRPSEH